MFNAILTDKGDNLFFLSLQGRLDTTTTPELEKTIKDLLASQGFRLIIDFTKLDFISSTGLRVILMAAKRAKSGNGRMVICCLQPEVKEIFEFSGFLKVLETSDTCLNTLD